MVSSAAWPQPDEGQGVRGQGLGGRDQGQGADGSTQMTQIIAFIKFDESIVQDFSDSTGLSGGLFCEYRQMSNGKIIIWVI